MTRKWLLALAGVCVVASAVCAYLAWSVKSPGLVAAEPQRDLGVLYQGQKLPIEFEVVNQWDQPLVIEGVRKSCSCTDVQFSTKALDPGDRAIVKATWSTGAMRGKSIVHIWVVYTLADGRAGYTEVVAQGTVIPDIQYEPVTVSFGTGESGPKSVRFTPGRMKEFRLKRAYGTHRAVTAELTEGASEVLVSFRVSEWSTDEKEPEVHLVVETDSPNQPSVYIPIKHQPK